MDIDQVLKVKKQHESHARAALLVIGMPAILEICKTYAEEKAIQTTDEGNKEHWLMVAQKVGELKDTF